METTNTTFFGRRAEGLACSYLENLGYKIIARNYKTRMGEIDIIAKRENLIVFVEVKYRTGHQSAMDYVNVKRIRKAASQFISKQASSDQEIGDDTDWEYRCDYIEILGPEMIIEHIENAF